MAASDSLPAGCPLPGSSPVIGRPAPAPLRSRAGPGRASPVPVATFHTFHAPYAGRFFGVASRCFTPSMAFTLRDWARLLLFPAYPAGTLTTRQASLHAADRVVAPPTRAFDIGLRPGPFPVRAADLLPGLLAVTRTGLAPAGDDEHASRRLRSSRTVLRLQGALPQGWISSGRTPRGAGQRRDRRVHQSVRGHDRFARRRGLFGCATAPAAANCPPLSAALLSRWEPCESTEAPRDAR